MVPPTRSFYLPVKLVNAFARETERVGLVREKAVAAAVLYFLESDPNARCAMFQKLYEYTSDDGAPDRD